MEQRAKVLDELSTQATQQVLDNLPLEEIGQLLNHLPMDEAAEILAEDVPHRQTELLGLMSPENAAEVRTLLQYPPKTAGRMMTEKFVRVQPEMTAGETLAHLRQVHLDVETLTDLYVLNPEGQLVGVVSLRDVVTAALPLRGSPSRMTTRMEI